MFTGTNIIDFTRRFPDSKSCMQYLEDLKWKKGFSCRRCGESRWLKGRTSHHRRCAKCKYDESPTAHTIFQDIRMPLIKAFHIIFRLSTKKKGMSSCELAAEVGVQQKTAWLLRSKLQRAMLNASRNKLEGSVVIDETLIGGERKGYKGRRHDDKEIAVVAVEQLADGRTGNISLSHTKSFSFDCLNTVIQNVIDPSAHLSADYFTTYRAVKKDRPNTELIVAKGSDFFNEIHKQIMMLKMWLTGIHHKCSKQHLKNYLREYEFRFNHRNKRKWIFHNLACLIPLTEPHPYRDRIRACG